MHAAIGMRLQNIIEKWAQLVFHDKSYRLMPQSHQNFAGGVGTK